MARIATLLLASTLVPVVDVSLYNLFCRPALTAGIAAVGDVVDVAPIIRDARFIGADIRALATLGAAATVKLVRFRPGDGTTVDLTAATTAGAASYANSNAVGSQALLAGDVIQLAIAGGNISAAAIVEVDVQLQH